MQAQAGEAAARRLGQGAVRGCAGVWGSGRGRVLSSLGFQEAQIQCWSAQQ